jgi:hypothetical protein
MDEVKYGFFIHAGQKDLVIETNGRLLEHDFEVLTKTLPEIATHWSVTAICWHDDGSPVPPDVLERVNPLVAGTEPPTTARRVVEDKE